MKILGIFLGNEIRTGGHTRYLELMEGLAGKGHDVTVYLNSFLAREPEHFAARRISIPYVRGKDRFLGLLFKKALVRETRRETPPDADWIVIFGETHWPAAKYLSRTYSISVLFAFRSDSIEESRTYLKYEKNTPVRCVRLLAGIAFDTFRERDITKKAARIVFQSADDRDRYVSRNRGATEKTAVIGGDIRQSRFRSEYALKNRSDRCRKLLFVGTLGRRKGLEYLLRALALVPDDIRPLLHLDILAAGADFSPTQKLLVRLGLAKIVDFRGKVTDPLRYMADADLLVVPSLFDSYPNVVLEALHVGLPVIGSRSGGIPSMLADPSLLFEPASERTLAVVLTRLVASDEAYANARTLCEARRPNFDFDWAAAWEEVLTAECT